MRPKSCILGIRSGALWVLNIMAAIHEVAPDALPYYDQGYDDPGVREMVSYLTRPEMDLCLSIHSFRGDVTTFRLIVILPLKSQRIRCA